MEQDRNRLFFFSLSFSFPFLSLVSQHVAAPDSFHSLFLPHGKNESYTKLRAKTFVVSILIGSMMGFFGRKKLFGILTFLVAFLAGNLSREVQKNVRRKSFRLVIILAKDSKIVQTNYWDLFSHRQNSDQISEAIIFVRCE